MSAKDTIKIGKFLSLVLRHSPETIQLELDENGWANIQELIEKSKTKNIYLTKEELVDIVTNNDKQRYSLNDKKTMIRANQGHSISIDLELQSIIPPEILYHGTATRFVDSIQTLGLDKRARQFVHLSKDIETAEKVGSRHGKPIILIVRASQMVADGFEFFQSANGVWLTDSVPTKYIVFSD